MGWGAAEAMSEILARNARLAGEFGKILLSYLWDLPGGGNFIDHHDLRMGAVWGAGRLAQARPEFSQRAGELLREELGRARDLGLSPDHLATTLWALGRSCPAPAAPEAAIIENFLKREEPAEVALDGGVVVKPLGQWAKEALEVRP